MSRHSEDVILAVRADQAFACCQAAVADLGWRVLELSPRRIACKEAARVTSFTNPVQMELRFESTPQGTRVLISGSNFGFGPIQNEHVRGQVRNLRNRIEVAARKSDPGPPTSTPNSVADQLTKLAELHDRGALSDTEFEQAKSRLLRET